MSPFPSLPAGKVPYGGRFRHYMRFLPDGRGEGLDVGCDRGGFTGIYVAAGKAASIVGVDVDPEVIEAARRKHARTGVSFARIDGGRLPFDEGRFDPVIATEVLEHVDDERAFLAELRRVIAPDGRLLLSVPHKGPFMFMDPFNFRYLLPRRVFLALYRRVKGYPFAGEWDRGFHRHYTPRHLRRLLAEAGFTIERRRRGGCFFVYLAHVFHEVLHRPLTRYRPLILLGQLLTWLGDVESRLPFGPLAAQLVVLASVSRSPNGRG